MGTLLSPPEPFFFQRIELASTVRTFFYFKNINLSYLAILLNNNIIVAMQYLETMIIFKNFCDAKTFNQTIRFVFEKLLKKLGSIISGRLHPASTDEIKTLKSTISPLRIYSYFHFQFTSYGLNRFIITIPLRNVINIAANV